MSHFERIQSESSDVNSYQSHDGALGSELR